MSPAIPPTVSITATEKRGKALCAASAIRRGEPIFTFHGEVRADAASHPNALQIGEDAYLNSTDGFDDYLNHSCDPNCEIDFKTMELVARRDIQAGEELTYDYHTTEYDLTAHNRDLSFECACGSSSCLKQVKGFRHLSPDEKEHIQEKLSPFLRCRHEAEKKHG